MRQFLNMWNILKKKVPVPVPIPKLDLGLGYWYRNLVTVAHYHVVLVQFSWNWTPRTATSLEASCNYCSNPYNRGLVRNLNPGRKWGLELIDCLFLSLYSLKVNKKGGGQSPLGTPLTRPLCNGSCMYICTISMLFISVLSLPIKISCHHVKS